MDIQERVYRVEVANTAEVQRLKNELIQSRQAVYELQEELDRIKDGSAFAKLEQENAQFREGMRQTANEVRGFLVATGNMSSGYSERGQQISEMLDKIRSGAATSMQALKELGVTPLESLVQKLEQISERIDKVQEAIANTGGQIGQGFGGSGDGVDRIIEKLNEMLDVIRQISKNPLKINFGSGSNGGKSDLTALELRKKQLQEYLNLVEQMYRGLSRDTRLLSGQDPRLLPTFFGFGELSQGAAAYDNAKLFVKIDSAASEKGLATVESQLNYFKSLLDEAYETAQKKNLTPPEIDTRSYDEATERLNAYRETLVATAQERQNAIKQIADLMSGNQASKQDVASQVDPKQLSGDLSGISAQLDPIRAKLEEVFNLSTIDLHLPEVIAKIQEAFSNTVFGGATGNTGSTAVSDIATGIAGPMSDAAQRTNEYADSIERLAQVFVKLEGDDIGSIAEHLVAGGVNGDIADKISAEFEDLSGRITSVKVNFDEMGQEGERVGNVIVTAMSAAGTAIQKVVSFSEDKDGNITTNVFGSTKTKYNIAEDYNRAVKAAKEYYSLLQKMYATGPQGRSYRQNVEEQNGSFVAKSDDVKVYVEQLNAAKAAMESYRASLNDDNSTRKQRDDLDALIESEQKHLDLLMETASRTDDERAEKERSAALKEAGELLERMIQLREEYNGKLKVTGSDAFQNNDANIAALQAMVDGVKNGTVEVDVLKGKLEELKGTTDANASSMRNLAGSTNSLASGISRYFAMMFSGYRIVMMAVREIKKMVSTSIELDSAMTQLQIVTKASDATMQQFGNTAAQVAKETATSITDVLDSATTYARLGYSLDESAILSKYTGMLQRVGNIEVGDAQDAITAIIKAYDVDAGQIESIMDKLVEVGNNFPISVSQIAEGMNNASASLAAAGNSFEKSVALLTAANTVVQNASKASTGLRTIAARLRNTKAELDELGEEPIATPKYEELVQQLTAYHVSLLDAAGNYRSTYDIMKDLAAVWDDIAPNIQAAITTALAGTRQQAIFNSIIDQFQEASGAMDAMADSAGALSDAYGVYMDSTQAHIDQFKAAFQELSQTAIDSGFISDFVDKGTTLINLLTKISGFVDTIGGLRTVLLSVVGVIATLKVTTWISKIQRVGRAIKLLMTDFSKFGNKLKENGMSMANFWTAMATVAIVAITSIINAIKKHREEQALAVKSAYESAFKEAKEGDAVFDAFEKYSDAKLAIDDNVASKAKLTQSTLELAKALGIETSAISGTKNELEELSKLELEEAIRKAEEAVKSAQSVLFQDTLTGMTASNNQKLLRQYAVQYFSEAAAASGYTRLWDGSSANYASDFAAWFESSDPERRVDAIRRVYEYMKGVREELEAAAKTDSSVLTSTEYTNVVSTINYLESDLNALDEAEALLAKRHEQYTKIVDRLASAAQRTRTVTEGSVAPVSAFAETAQLLKDSLGEAWELEDFAKTREELSKLAGEINGITPDKIIELAKESDVLAVALQQDGMDARFLAHVLQSELTGGPGFDLITEEALALNKALNGLSDEYEHLSDSRAKYESGKSTKDKDDDFRSMAEAYKTLSEELEKGRINSDDLWDAAEYLFGSERLEEWNFDIDKIRETVEKNKAVFEDVDSAGAGFLTRLKEISDESGNVVDSNGEVIASIQQLEDGSVDFDIDEFRLDELSKKLGISRDAIMACVKALNVFGRVDMTDMGQVFDALKEIGLGGDFDTGGVVNATEVYNTLRETLGYNAKEAADVMAGLEDMGVTLVDLSAPTEQLAQQFVALGVAEDNAGSFTVNIDGLISLMQQLQLTDEQANNLVSSLGDANNVSFVDAEGSAIGLDNAIQKVAKANFKKAASSSQELKTKIDLSKKSTEELYAELTEMVGKTYIINMDRRQLEDAYRRALELRNVLNNTNNVGAQGVQEDSRGFPSSHGAHGITNAAPGKTLVGEEEPELWVQDGQAQLVGVHGPEIIETKAGDRIFKGSDTRKILKNVRFIRGTIPAMNFGGTVSIPGWSPSSVGASSYSGGSSGSSGSGSSSSSSKKGESAFEKEYKRHQHLLKMEAETQREYLVWLNDAYKKAYNNNEIELEDFWKYEEEVYQGMKDLFMDYLNDIEHEIDMIGEDRSRVNRIVELYSTAVKAVEKEIEAARKAGLKDTDDYIQQLQKKIKDYQKELTSMREDAQKELEDSEQELVDMRIKMIKQEIDDRKDGLNKQLSDLKDFYQKQKDMLRDARDEEKYLDDQAEKRKKVADIERELSALQRDDSAWAAKRRLELEQNLADARKELREFERDHAIDVAEEELDKISELREKYINAQIEELENITPHDLYEWASYDIKHATNDLYEAMIEYNNVYGDGIEKNIIDMWDRAKAAFEDYWNTVRALTNDGDSIMMRIAGGFFREAKEYVSSSNLKFVSGTPLKFASGTPYAPAGLHILDEYGSETIFQSKNGQKYKMFTGGEKVLNAKASEFLYKFATSGGEFLSKLVNGAANGLNYLTGGGRRLAVEAVNMGDIIINGNADRSTVSEIRRAQRDALENLLHEFDRLSR